MSACLGLVSGYLDLGLQCRSGHWSTKHCSRLGSTLCRGFEHRPAKHCTTSPAELRRSLRPARIMERVPAMVDAPPLPPASAGEGDSNCRAMFSEFMTKVAQFEEQAEAGKRLLTRFHQELEYFRRPPIPKDSDVMSEILKSNCTGRMKSYLEAGCSLQCRNISNINQLRLCEEGLKDHINRVKMLLRELECLVKDAHGITLTANLSALELSESPSTDIELNNTSCFIEEEGKQEDKLDNDVSFVTVMIMVQNMLNLDYTMQEKIVNALSLKTPSSELEGYCLMWDLRPYIDDNVMHLAWKMCP